MIFCALIPFAFLAKKYLVSILPIFTVPKQSLSLSLTVRDIIRKKESNTMKNEPRFLKNMD